MASNKIAGVFLSQAFVWIVLLCQMISILYLYREMAFMNGRLSSYEIDQTERMQGFTTIGILLEKVSWLEEQHLERPIVNKKITTRSNDKGKMSR